MGDAIVFEIEAEVPPVMKSIKNSRGEVVFFYDIFEVGVTFYFYF